MEIEMISKKVISFRDNMPHAFKISLPLAVK